MDDDDVVGWSRLAPEVPESRPEELRASAAGERNTDSGSMASGHNRYPLRSKNSDSSR
jgi:hypothetical protein